jgi:hypothetical protein
VVAVSDLEWPEDQELHRAALDRERIDAIARSTDSPLPLHPSSAAPTESFGIRAKEHGMSKKRVFVLTGAVLAGLATGAIGAHGRTAGPSPFALVFDGRHEAAADSPVGFWHEGRFTATGAFCSAGSARTLEVRGNTPGDAEGKRLLTCGDGSGSVTALVLPMDGEHGGTGVWRIVAGTGAYVKLRGRGTFTGVRTGGDPADHGSITFRSTWSGVVDRDDTPPDIAVTRVRVAKLGRPSGSYLLAIAFSAQEAPGNAVRYLIDVSGRGRFLASRVGEMASGKTSAAIRVRPAKNVRRLHVEITASDPLGNERTVSRDLRLPR